MKRILFFVATLMLACITNSRAAELHYVRMGQPESRYVISQSTVSFSSSTVTTIAAVDGYRLVKIRDLTESTSFFYRLDGSTQSITTVGFLNKGTEVFSTESNAAMYFQLAAGVASKVFQVLTFQK